jgi:hypothetical protein
LIQIVATVACIAAIFGLFSLDRDANVRTSKALWIPQIWLLIIGSRAVSKWMQSDSLSSMANQFSEGSPVDASVFAVLILSAILVLNFRSRQVTAFLRANAPILFYFFFCALSILWSDFPLVATKRWVKAVGDLLMVLVVLSDPHPLVATKRLFSRVAFILLPLSVLFIACYPNLGTIYDRIGRITYYVGVTTQKNELGQTAMICGLFSLWCFLSAFEDRRMPRRGRHLIAYGLMIATAVGLILRADSMTSLSCLGLAGAVMVLCTQRWVSRKNGGIHLLISSAVALPLFAVFLDAAGTLLHSVGRNTTLTGRTLIWKTVLSLHTNPFIGTGFESFWLGSRLQRVWETAQKGISEALNGYLEVYLNLGYIGLALLAWLIVAGYNRTLADFHRDPQANRIRLAIFTTAMIYSLTEAGFQFMNLLWIAFLIAMVRTPMPIQHKTPHGTTTPPRILGAASKPHPLLVRRPFETL